LTSAEICPECGADEACRTKQRETDEIGQDVVAICTAGLSVLIAFAILKWFDRGAMQFSLICISPIALLIGSIMWMQRSAVSLRHLVLNSVFMLALFGALYFFLLRSVQGGTDPLGPGLVYMFASIIIGPILGYGLAPSIIVLLWRKEPSGQ